MSAVRVVVLTGAGDHFCAGGDLKEMQVQATRTRPSDVTDATELATLLAELDRLKRPIVGRINGSAYGGGLGLISICDVAIGVTTAKYCLTEVRLGLVPATISPYVVARLGARNARRVMLNATEMDGAAAVRWGLLHEVVEPDALDAAVEREIAAFLHCAGGRGRLQALDRIRQHTWHEREYSIYRQSTGRSLGEHRIGRGDRRIFGEEEAGLAKRKIATDAVRCDVRCDRLPDLYRAASGGRQSFC